LAVLADLIKRMLVVDASQRATISDVAWHPWVQMGATTSQAPTINHMMSPDQISSFMSGKPPKLSHAATSLPPSSPQGGCPVFHHSAPPVGKKPLPPLAPDIVQDLRRATGSPQNFAPMQNELHMSSLNTRSPHSPHHMTQNQPSPLLSQTQGMPHNNSSHNS